MPAFSFPTFISGSRMITNPPQAMLPAVNSRYPSAHAMTAQSTACTYGDVRSPFLHRLPLGSRCRSMSPVAFNAKTDLASSGKEDNRALEAVLKLYNAIKTQNVRELSDIIGDECRCVCNFFSFLHLIEGKQQVLDFFIYLIRNLGNHIEFIVHPTLHDGMNVGVAWRLEWSKTHFPLGKGFSFHICHIYHGKVVIGNVEMFMEPLLHLEPFRLKMMAYLMLIIDRITSYKLSKDKVIKAVLAMVLIATIWLFLRPGLYHAKKSIHPAPFYDPETKK